MDKRVEECCIDMDYDYHLFSSKSSSHGQTRIFTQKMLFSVNEKVLCFHVGLLYEAKVLQAEKWTGEENLNKDVGPHYFVHYMGWRARWDEWVPESRMLKLNEDNIGKQKALLESVKAAQEAKNHESIPILSTTKATARKSGGGGGGGSGSNTVGGSGMNGSGTSTGREASESHEFGDRRKSKESSRGTKRGRDAIEQEDEYIKRPEIKLNIPEPLKVRLVDDWEFVTKRNLLVPLPRTPTVEEILSSYRIHYLSVKKDHKASRPPAVLDEVLEGIKAYFNKALGNNLLYRFERTQYVQQRKVWNVEGEKDEDQEMEPSKIYGAEHLLRLFVNLPSIIAHTTMDAESILLLKEHLAEFLAFMVKEQKKFFVNEYEAQSMSYHRLSYT